MSQYYSNPDRETDPYSLPDIELWWQGRPEGDLEVGYYYWFCFPGCLPDSDPCGPFSTRKEALKDARGD